MRIVVVGLLAESLVSFRGDMLAAMVAAGHEVVALAPNRNDRVEAALTSLGVSFDTFPLQRASLAPLHDIQTTMHLVRAFGRARAGTVFVYGAKPVVFGLVAARLAGVPTRAAMITGLGSAMSGAGIRRRLLRAVTRGLYAVSLRHAHIVFFQNPDDERTFRSLGLVGARHTVVRVNGSGVDLDRFRPSSLPAGPITFLMIARLIADKGVREYVAAARMVRALHPEVRFQLLGGLDPNPSGITSQELADWIAEGVIEYLGVTPDVRPYIEAAHCGVLPSYGEGTPRSSLEMIAMGRAIVTTDVPGCRETVIPGRNGLLVAVRDSAALGAALLTLIENPERLGPMGVESRRLAEDRFDVHLVNRVILSALSLA